MLYVRSLKHPDVFKGFVYAPALKSSIAPALVCGFP